MLSYSFWMLNTLLLLGLELERDGDSVVVFYLYPVRIFHTLFDSNKDAPDKIRPRYLNLALSGYL